MPTSKTALCIALSVVVSVGPESVSFLNDALGSPTSALNLGVRQAYAYAPPRDQKEEARELYDKGRIAYDTGDYEEAVRLWKQAYALVPTDEDSRAIRHEMVYNLAEAHIRVYRVKGTVESLRTAKVLLEDYIRRHEVLYGDGAEAIAERKAAQERLGDVDRMLKGTKSSSSSTTTQPTGEVTPASEPAAKPEGPVSRERTKEEVLSDPGDAPKWKNATGLVIAGGVMMGVGGLIGLGGLGLAPARALDGASAAETFGTSGALVLGGGAVFIAGAIMLGVGVTRRKELKKKGPSTAWSPAGSLAAAPYFSATGGGLSLQARF